MATSQMSNTVRQLRHVALCHSDTEVGDGQLLNRFAEARDESAFAGLMHRHSKLVWCVCRRVLGHHQDAEDAFQATFLVLARKAGAIRRPALLANWLYGVAYRTALKAKSRRVRLRTAERQVVEMPEPQREPDAWRDLEPLIDQELAALPEKYRVAIVLCDLEGRTGKAVSRQLRIPEGTLSSRLRTARVMLARRLARRGLTCSGGALATMLCQHAAAAGAPGTVLSSTLKAAPLVAAGHVATGLVSATATALMEGVLKAMLATKLKVLAMIGVVLGMLTLGGGLLSQHTAAGPADPAKHQVDDRIREHRAPAPWAVGGPSQGRSPTTTEAAGRGSTKRSAGNDRRSRVAYSVADLVVPIPFLDSQDGKTKEEWLIGKIASSIVPESWDSRGGSGSLKYDPERHTLIVNNLASVQAKVKALLETMRRVQDVQVAAETRVIRLSDTTYRKLTQLLPQLRKDDQAVLSDAELFALIRRAQDEPDTQVLQLPKITIFPGQRVKVAADHGGEKSNHTRIEIKLNAHVAANLQHLDLDVQAKIDNAAINSTVRLVDGSNLVRFERNGSEHLGVILTPRVILNFEQASADAESDAEFDRPSGTTKATLGDSDR